MPGGLLLPSDPRVVSTWDAVSRIFLSHSSVNEAEAVALRDWLLREGWDDLFLDIDPRKGISPERPELQGRGRGWFA